ncbi:hypothetical protein FSST1_006454 [Fusarium sambucinum]
MSNPLDYTIGLITALRTEYVAAQVFLDEKHPEPKCRSPGDPNHYTLGRIGNHNVVITVLPAGQYGLTSAAMVASDMRHSFPYINSCLLVGIAGGAPNHKNDIRLGDVVVSTPSDDHGGVFQYDFGRSIQQQDFQHTQHLNQPPMIFQEATKRLRAQHKATGTRLHNAVVATLKKHPRLQKTYGRPGTPDQLYLPDIIHSETDGASCFQDCGSDPSSLVDREQRTGYELDPSVHYGLIASGNTLCRDATLRDKISTEKDILCFEMEAAGVMNIIPCIVVRGICDYSDSHKNKDWQGYAAMTAAAYAKDLLRHVPSTMKNRGRASYTESVSTRQVELPGLLSKGGVILGRNCWEYVIVLVLLYLSRALYSNAVSSYS